MTNLVKNTAISFLDEPTRFFFFTGKGGVGKTSLSCASALALADQGKKVLLVSTDPASNLGQVLEVSLNSQPCAIDGASGLWALNIDPRQSAAQYRERVVGPYRGVLPETAIAEIEEQLSGACTVEIAAFDEFSRLMTDEQTLSQYDHIVFDTAPTGHTLRLLRLPAAWKGYLGDSSGNASCLGPMSGLKGQKQQFEDTLNALTDTRLTRLILVARPDAHSIAEAHRTSCELADIGVHNQWFAINGILRSDGEDAVSAAMRHREDTAMASIPPGLQSLRQTHIRLSSVSPIGIPALRMLFSEPSNEATVLDQTDADASLDGTMDFQELLDGMDVQSGVIMTMGKGGVGKTTLACRIASELAKRGLQVHLTTSDPAAHLDVDLSSRCGNLRVSRIDPQVETENYRREVLQQAGAELDEQGRQLLEEDLRSPCTEEVAVFRAFARVVEEAAESVVILDTAPTGHTLLLLDATEAYHREVNRNRTTIPNEVRHLLPRLRDPNYTRIMIVTLPEATPVQEAMDLQNDLERAQMRPYAWVVNQSLLPLSISDPVLASRRMQEITHLSTIKKTARRVAVVPWQVME